MACNAARSAAFAPPQAVIRVQRKLHFHTTAQLWYLHTRGASNSLSEATSYRCISSGTSYEAVFYRCVFIGRMFPLPCISQWLRHHILRRIGSTAAYAAVTSRPAGALSHTRRSAGISYTAPRCISCGASRISSPPGDFILCPRQRISLRELLRPTSHIARLPFLPRDFETVAPLRGSQ